MDSYRKKHRCNIMSDKPLREIDEFEARKWLPQKQSAAVKIIVEEAGGKVTNHGSGRPDQ
jgi:hypothetical protein